MSLIAPIDLFRDVPFSILLDNVGKLQIRYHSISCSSFCSAKRISIAAVVDPIKFPRSPFELKFINTKYSLALNNKLCSVPCKVTSEAHLPLPIILETHTADGPRAVDL